MGVEVASRPFVRQKIVQLTGSLTEVCGSLEYSSKGRRFVHGEF
jgi:hypothetical protein